MESTASATAFGIGTNISIGIDNNTTSQPALDGATDAIRAGAGNQSQSQHQASRASLMRYSTPNLQLATNFEHIIKQREKVSAIALAALAGV